MDLRRQKLLERIDLATQKGLEIGALDRPVVTRAQGDIRYVDYASTEALREMHASTPSVRVEGLVDVDYVWGERTLRELVGPEARFDYVIASHVIEHVPDLVTWLGEIAEVLAPGGVLSLIVPDKRYTFDRLRRTTDITEVVDAWLARRRKPSVQQVFDHYLRHTRVDVQRAWAGQLDDARLELVHDERLSLAVCREAAAGRYVDAHCWVFTPHSFFELLRYLAQLDLLPFRVARYHPPVQGEIDFFVTLERLAEGLSAEERRTQVLASLPRLAPPSDVEVLAEALRTRAWTLVDGLQQRFPVVNRVRSRGGRLLGKVRELRQGMRSGR